MFAYIIKRILLMVPTLFGVLTITFVIAQFVPGGPVEQLIAQMRERSLVSGTRGGHDLDPKRIEQLKALYGFDKPPVERYVLMLKNFLRFDFGKSFSASRDVWDVIKSKLGVTLSLGAWSFLVIYLISIPLGVAKAVREGSRFDVATTLLVLVGFAIPGFVLGVLLIVLFAGGSFLDWFPVRGLFSDNWSTLSWPARITDYLWHLTLPLICLTIGSFATLTVLTKNTFVEEMRKQYVLVVRAKGLSERAVLYKHIFRNALLPIITGLPAAVVGVIFGGSLLIEQLFSLDGMGRLSYDSVIRRDYPVVLATAYLYTLLGLVARLLSDLAYVAADPRIQFGSAAR
ncbi:MAG: ABC transporter permease subunit [Burkholderiaceae bacterium]|jgi:microcin C transport system permease protein